MPDDPAVGEVSADGKRFWDGDIWGWQPLWLTADEVIDAVRQQFGPRGHSARLLAEGMLNQSWRVEADEHAWVLRVSRIERPRKQIAYEHAYVRQLKKRLGFVVAALPGRDGDTIQQWRGRLVSLFPFVEGVAGTALDPTERAGHAAEALARIHRVSLDQISVPQRPGFRSVDDHPRWIWSDVRPVLSRELPGTPEVAGLLAVFDRESAALDAWLDGLHAARRPLPRAAVHGDFNPRNLIFGADGIVAVIDWDECHNDLLAWEVAQAGFGAYDVSPPDFWQAYLDAGGPLARDDFGLLGGFARMGALSELQYAVHNGLVRPRVLELLHDLAAGLTWLHDRERALGSL